MATSECSTPPHQLFSATLTHSLPFSFSLYFIPRFLLLLLARFLSLSSSLFTNVLCLSSDVNVSTCTSTYTCGGGCGDVLFLRRTCSPDCSLTHSVLSFILSPYRNLLYKANLWPYCLTRQKLLLFGSCFTSSLPPLQGWGWERECVAAAAMLCLRFLRMQMAMHLCNISINLSTGPNARLYMCLCVYILVHTVHAVVCLCMFLFFSPASVWVYMSTISFALLLWYSDHPIFVCSNHQRVFRVRCWWWSVMSWDIKDQVKLHILYVDSAYSKIHQMDLQKLLSLSRSFLGSIRKNWCVIWAWVSYSCFLLFLLSFSQESFADIWHLLFSHVAQVASQMSLLNLN